MLNAIANFQTALIDRLFHKRFRWFQTNSFQQEAVLL